MAEDMAASGSAATPLTGDQPFSKNERAERLFGRRRTDVMFFDYPTELGYWCPVCRVAYPDEALEWSEYNAFIWCLRCNRDYPSALCVPLDGAPDSEREWVNVGPEAAVKVFLETVADAVRRATVSERSEPAEGRKEGGDRWLTGGS